MSDYGRFAYEPVMDLDTGRAVGLEVRRLQARDLMHGTGGTTASSRQAVDVDAGVTVTAVLGAVAAGLDAALHLDVLGETALAAREVLGRLPGALRRDGHLAPVLLEIAGLPTWATAGDLTRAVAELREAGFLIALDAVEARYGLEVVAAVAPDLAKLGPGLVGRLDADTHARTVAAAVVSVCDSAGVPVAADGVATRKQLDILLDLGVRLGQGPLLAPARPEPLAAGVLLPWA